MRITNVRACQPVAPNSPPDWRTSIGQILVAVDTDAGLTGYGVGGGGLAGVHVVNSVLRELLLGAEPEPVEAHWQRMYDATLAFGQKGIALMAVSGVDLALWDLRGKAAGKPVAELLGGDVSKPLPTYVTVWDEPTPELAAQHQGFKLHVEHRQGGDRVEPVVEAVRQARSVIGPDAELMLDAWMRWDVETTLAVAEAVRPFDVAWIEEPLPADDWAGYAELAQSAPVPVAGGEHEYTAKSFRMLAERGLHRVLQPDVCWCGGLTELVKIYQLVDEFDVRVCPHRGSEPWALHAVNALDPHPLAESGRPWMTWVGGQPAVEDGTIRLSDRPGLGVEIDETSLTLVQPHDYPGWSRT